MRFNFWNIKILLDDVFFELVNYILIFTSFFNKNARPLKYNSTYKDIHHGERCFIVGNAPSILNQDILKLKNENVTCVNRAHELDFYSKLRPRYHVIIDTKLIQKIWPWEMILDIKSINPNVTFILNSKWYSSIEFKSFLAKNHISKIIWIDTRLFTTRFSINKVIDLTRITYGGAVMGAAKVVMLYMGCTKIYFTGQEANGLCYELLNMDTHAYGYNPENKLKGFNDYYVDLYMMSLSLKHYISLNKIAINHGAEIINITDGGILDMFRREDFNEITF